MMQKQVSTIQTPVGLVVLMGEDGALQRVHVAGPAESADLPDDRPRNDSALSDAAEQIAAYFSGDLAEFDLRLDPRGTAFQRRVWEAISTIPFGQTASYADMARQTGRPTAARAVGAATGLNPLAIVVPCHRVIGSTGKLTGYAGGLEMKKALLGHEGVLIGG